MRTLRVQGGVAHIGNEEANDAFILLTIQRRFILKALYLHPPTLVFLFMDLTKMKPCSQGKVPGGSQYLLMDQVSQILQDHGHDVFSLQQNELLFTLGILSILWTSPVQKKYNMSYKCKPHDIIIFQKTHEK